MNLLLISETLKNLPKNGDHYKLYIYFLNKIFRGLILTKKLDPDYYLDLREDYEAVQKQILENKSLEQLTLNNGLFFTWFDPENIPDQIDFILKEIRSEGLLR